MTQFLFLIVVIGQFVLSPSVLADAPCKNPKPAFGKVLAICGDQMITYVGDQKLEVLGVTATQSEFEFAYCKNGGGRKSLRLQSNSEGYELVSEVYEREGFQEKYEISRMWGDFRMTGTDYNGKPVNVKCVGYTDARTDIEYIF